MPSLEIFNLEFPAYIDEVKIGSYLFKRVSSYESAFKGMMHLVSVSGSEFEQIPNTGSHRITAIVECPHQEKNSVLPWSENGLTELDDILFLLSLFTGRNVFKKNWSAIQEIPIIADHRSHHFGGQLHLALSYESGFKDKKTGEIQPKETIILPAYKHHQVNIGFEKSLNRVLNTLQSEEWLAEYESGYFLFLYRSAVQRQIIESSFILCWTIWEHLFAIKKRKCLNEKDIRKMSGDKKIAFILNHYFLKDIDAHARQNIERINRTRNRIIHYGVKTENVDLEEMELFIRLTEQLVAIILELLPSNIFNSFEKLEGFLSNSKN